MSEQAHSIEVGPVAVKLATLADITGQVRFFDIVDMPDGTVASVLHLFDGSVAIEDGNVIGVFSPKFIAAAFRVAHADAARRK